MPTVVIRQVGPNLNLDPTETYPMVPCFDAYIGEELLLKAWVQLDADAVEPLKHQLGLLGLEEVESLVDELLYLYGTRRLERLCLGLSPDNPRLEEQTAVWQINREGIHVLIALAAELPCEYRRKAGRDYFCTTPSPGDPTVVGAIDGRRVAPTSMPLCQNCALPSTDYLCSMFSHPEVTGIATDAGILERRLMEGMCNAGQSALREDPSACRAGGHDCWRRFVDIEELSVVTHSAPSDLPQALDTLGGFWRLTFGKSHRLLQFHTTTEVAELALDCTTREEFRSRMSALADVISRFVIDDDLLPDSATDQQRKGTLNRLQVCLKHKVSDALYAQVEGAIRTLRNVVDVRNAFQHSGAAGGLAKALEKLQIRDAPPNWSGAWNQVRALTADALVALRTALSQQDEADA